MTDLAYSRTGDGEPLILVHGIGASKAVWRPVIDRLAERFDVIAVDLPGHGESPPLPAEVEPMPAAVAAALAAFLERLEVEPVHLVGNSLGGWVALEVAKIRQVRSVTLLSPAGLWRRHSPLNARATIWAAWWLVRHATRVLLRLAATAPGRTAVLGLFHGRPWAMPAEQAHEGVVTLARCPAFAATMRASTRRRFLDGTGIAAPVTVAFGSRDLILLAHQSRHLDQLPATVRTVALPRCGHVPMSDDPGAVAEAIVQATRARTAAGTEGSGDRPQPRASGR